MTSVPDILTACSSFILTLHTLFSFLSSLLSFPSLDCPPKSRHSAVLSYPLTPPIIYVILSIYLSCQQFLFPFSNTVTLLLIIFVLCHSYPQMPQYWCTYMVAIGRSLVWSCQLTVWCPSISLESESSLWDMILHQEVTFNIQVHVPY